MLSMMNASPRASRDASGSSGAASPDSYNPAFSGSDQENYAHDQRQSLPMQGSLGKPRAIAVRGDGVGAPQASTSASAGKQSAAAARKEKRSTKSKCPPGLRSGKWTPEEEAYTNTIIHYFKRGLLDIDDGTSLRWFLAKRLNCEAMRVTKKLKGNSSIGKQIFRALENTPENRMAILHAKDELAVLERQFLDSLLAAGQPGQMNGMGLMRGRGGRPGSGGRPATLQDDANLLLHFFVGAHDNVDPDDSQPARTTNPSNVNLNVQLKIDKKRPFTSISNTASSESSNSSSASAAASSEKRGASASASPSKRRSGVKIEDLMD